MSAKLTIAVYTPNLGGPYVTGVLSGVTWAIEAAGGQVVVVQTLHGRTAREPRLWSSEGFSPISLDQVSGCIGLLNAIGADRLRYLQERGKAVALIAHEYPDVSCPSVCTDNAGGIRDAVAHLVDHGHTRIAYAGVIGQQTDMRARFHAYEQALADHGLEGGPSLVFEVADMLEAGGREAGQLMLQAGLPATAVIASNDFVAAGIIGVLEEAGIRLPQDVAIVGFDNIEFDIGVSLTTVMQREDVLGITAVNLVLDQIAGRPVRPGRHVIPGTLLRRESCGCGPDAVRPASSVPTRTEVRTTGASFAAALRALVTAAHMTTDESATVSAGLAELASSYDAARAGGVLPSTLFLERAFTAVCQRLRTKRTTTELQALVQALRELDEQDSSAGSEQRKLFWCQAELAATSLQLRDRTRNVTELNWLLHSQHDVGIDMLRGQEGDPRRMSWLSATAADFACLAAWQGQEREQLSVVGTFDRNATAGPAAVEVLSVELFPPRALIEQARAHSLVVFTLPVHVNGAAWGLLAVAAPLVTALGNGRVTSQQWLDFLTVALEHQLVADSLAASEERYLLAAQATNDGLWDWDLVTGAVFYSARWHELLQVPVGSVEPTAAEWLDRVHPDDRAELEAVIAAACDGRLERFQREHRLSVDGVDRWFSCHGIAVRGSGARPVRIVGSLTDISDRRELEDRLRRDALHDPLTGLANRRLFQDVLAMAVARAQRRAANGFAVLFLDLDDFKPINDTLGHAAGDELLVEVAARLQRATRASDLAARFGGDEFAVLINDLTDMALLPVIAARLADAFATPFRLNGRDVDVTASIGTATSEDCYPSADDVLKAADVEMYRSKARAKSRRHVAVGAKVRPSAFR